ncbi:aldose 1-epimerase [Altererythrobacter atlanticus]|uniref:Aldose 1-epimerase n=1 Tax=Croceibacterium atlanticum TaxID=1267766 RepID=A0A0F7KVP6_9SPHN|nr:aldose epimerase family protein [Croceibacterium atlanticum]AKH43226.1 Aldose 1-epimerase precursor [Croceibacterium atlanticum]MBB5732069.1 aldose 1-epimerase [Croceibacterium atlanticum]
MKAIILGLAAATSLFANPALAADAQRETAGALADGRTVEAVTLSNANGVSARILTYGATLQSLTAPDRDGEPSDITLGYDEAAKYQTHPNYFGVTVGRYANRIAGGQFTLDGKRYQLAQNDGANSLHGGAEGFDKRLWRIISVEEGPVAKLVLGLSSADGDQGYPGSLDVTVTYTLDDHGDLGILFEASSDAPTVVNMTNHALFNLAGQGSGEDAMQHWLMIPASRYTPVDDALIPTGDLEPVSGTVFDFREPRLIAQGLREGANEQIVKGRGYDHNWVLDKGMTAMPELVARLAHSGSGRVLDVLSTEPGVQFYSGNFLDGTVTGKGGTVYRMGDGIALEPQKFPDTPNQPAFGSARVEPGKPYRHAMIYRVYTMPEGMAERP